MHMLRKNGLKKILTPPPLKWRFPALFLACVPVTNQKYRVPKRAWAATDISVRQMCAHHLLESNIETGRGSCYFEHPRMLSLVLEHYAWKLRGTSSKYTKVKMEATSPSLNCRYFFAGTMWMFFLPVFFCKLRMKYASHKAEKIKV